MKIPTIHFERSKLATSLVEETRRRRDASSVFDAEGLIDECFSLGYVARRMWSYVKDVFFSDAQDVESLGDSAKEALDEHMRVVEKTIELARSVGDCSKLADQLGRLEEELAAIRKGDRCVFRFECYEQHVQHIFVVKADDRSDPKLLIVRQIQHHPRDR